MEQKIEDSLVEFGLKIDDDARRHLYKAAGWTKFISISIFSVAVLLIIIMIAAKNQLAVYLYRTLGGSYNLGVRFWIMMGLILLMIAMVAVIYYFLFHFSVKTRKGLNSENTRVVNLGFRSLKIYFIITTILSGLVLLLNLFGLFTKFTQ